MPRATARSRPSVLKQLAPGVQQSSNALIIDASKAPVDPFKTGKAAEEDNNPPAEAPIEDDEKGGQAGHSLAF